MGSSEGRVMLESACQLYRAAARTAVPEIVTGDRADEALETRYAVQRLAQRRAVNVQRIPVHKRNLRDGREQHRRGVVGMLPVPGSLGAT